MYKTQLVVERPIWKEQMPVIEVLLYLLLAVGGGRGTFRPELALWVEKSDLLHHPGSSRVPHVDYSTWCPETGEAKNLVIGH